MPRFVLCLARGSDTWLGMDIPHSRRRFLHGTLLLAAFTAAGPRFAAAQDEPAEAAVLRDPEIPAAGNAKGDITIVEFSDYQCPHCKTSHVHLERAAKEDGRIRLVFKSWPIFGEQSVYAAQMALAAREQNKYNEAHRALMLVKGQITPERTQKALADAGIDVARAQDYLNKNVKTIGAILKRNHDQAEAFGFQGTPAFIIGKFRVPYPLDLATFKLAIADARKSFSGK